MTVTLAFLIYKYFPYGGLQRDFARVLTVLQGRGHHCRVYCTSWQGDELPGVDLRIAPVTRGSNVRRNERFLAWVKADMREEPVAGVIGFNKMPGLDVYYAGDTCYLDAVMTSRRFLYRLGWRYRHFASWERAVFDRASATEILLISAREKASFERHYQTQTARMHLLPPGIEPNRQRPEDVTPRRAATRHSLGLQYNEHTLLFVGSGFTRKGLDRAIRGLASLCRTFPERRFRLLVAGQDGVGSLGLLARRQQVREQVEFLGGRDDIPDLLLAADVLVHPARSEAAGIVLLEALVAGLPVVVTDVCGYASYIATADAGLVLPAPFEQGALDAALVKTLDREFREGCRSSGLKYAEKADLYSLHTTAASLIEHIIRRKRAGTGG
jgi:UDP-glucose:(heptosyl)LPS alpha-1,3-glucosyltransferase